MHGEIFEMSGQMSKQLEEAKKIKQLPAPPLTLAIEGIRREADYDVLFQGKTISSPCLPVFGPPFITGKFLLNPPVPRKNSDIVREFGSAPLNRSLARISGGERLDDIAINAVSSTQAISYNE